MVLKPSQARLRMLEDNWKSEGPVTLELDMKKKVEDD